MNFQALLAPITFPLSVIYAAVVKVRACLFDCGMLRQHTYPIPIICVGNLSVGGTGKTPHVEYILRLLHQEGYRVAMLSRGYGRKTHGYILADVHRHTATDIGDEPYQMMLNCPYATIAVCEKRAYGIEQLMQLSPKIDVIVLDDAFQHRYVKAGLNVLLTDAHRLYIHDHLLPWGRLREPLSAAKRAQVVVVTKCVNNEKPSLPLAQGQQLFYSSIAYGLPQWLKPSNVPMANYKGQRIMLVAGIANPMPLYHYLQQQGAEVELVKFPDHHTFNNKDIAQLNRTWQQKHCTLAVTTQKDSTRLQLLLNQLATNLSQHLVVQPITVKITNSIPNKQSFNQIILHYVRTNKRNCSVD